MQDLFIHLFVVIHTCNSGYVNSNVMLLQCKVFSILCTTAAMSFGSKSLKSVSVFEVKLVLLDKRSGSTSNIY